MTLPPDIARLAQLGWHLYPASTRSKAGCLKGATDKATTDLDTLDRWARQFPGCNWRVVMGPSKLFALDCDVPPGHAHDGIANLAELVKVHGAIPPRPQLRSGGGGLAIFFRHDGEKLLGDGGHPAAGIDPRRGRQSQTLPPSVHLATKRAYRWLTAPWELRPPPAPPWLLRLLAPPPLPAWHAAPSDSPAYANRLLLRAAQAIAQAANGQRNAVLNRRAFQIGKLIGASLLSEQEAIENLYGAARSTGLEHAEIKATLKSGIASGIRRSGTG